jgi:two-component system sensor histidine kinase/response regulator
MSQRILIVDSGRRRASVWKTRLAAVDTAIVGPFNSAARVRPSDVGGVALVVIDAASLGEGGIELVNGLRAPGETPPPLLVVTISAGDEAQRGVAMRMNADEILEEPIDAQLLAVCTKNLLRVKAARDELSLATREFARARDERRMLADTLVHDLKNPIAVVHVNLAWAVERLGTGWPDVADALADAQGGLASLRHLVDDLLMVGMLEQSRVRLKREAIRVTELFDEAIKSHEREARARNVSLTMSLDEDVRVVGDSAVLRRAVSNMVETSLRHTPSSGKIALSARSGAGTTEQPESHGSIEIAVSSTGRPGYEDRQPLRADGQPTAPRLPSGGLALYFTRAAVEAHAGELDVVDNAEGPSSVVIRLPATG